MTKLALGAILFFVWFFFLALVVDTGKDENVAVWFLGYLAIIVVTIFEFVIILNQYFGIKLSDLIL